MAFTDEFQPNRLLMKSHINLNYDRAHAIRSLICKTIVATTELFRRERLTLIAGEKKNWIYHSEDIKCDLFELISLNLSTYSLQMIYFHLCLVSLIELDDFLETSIEN